MATATDKIKLNHYVDLYKKTIASFPGSQNKEEGESLGMRL